MMYLKGKGTKPSRERALEWLTKSAQRFTLSQMALIELEQAPPESETPQQNASQ
jgi:TPR repeat protein